MNMYFTPKTIFLDQKISRDWNLLIAMQQKV